MLFGDTADEDVGAIRYVHHSDDNSMRFITNTQERLRLTAAGNATFTGIVTASNFVKADGSPVGGFTTDNNFNLIAGVGAGSSIGAEEVYNIFLGFNAGAKIDHNSSPSTVSYTHLRAHETP